jgi:hypothetical protein
LNTTSTNGQQNNTFLDSSTNNFTITRNGSPTQGSITPYWPNGQWSNYFSSGNYINAASDAAFGMGTGDFTIEAWIFATSAFSGYQAIFGDGSTTNSLFFGNTTSGFGLRAGNVADILVTTAPSINQWFHVACTRNGTIVRLFYNGVQQATTTNSTNFVTQTAYIGNDGGGSAFVGYISNLRLVKGTAVYTANFTPSTTPLTAITNTSLLTCQSNRFKDNSTNNFAFTITGTPRVQAFQPFSPTASYTTALYGGSGYFNGSTDYLTLTNSSALNPGTGAFTFECWAYATSSTLNSGGQSPSFLEGRNNGLGVGINTSGQLAIAQSFVSFLLADTVAFPSFQWVHIVAVRSGTNLSLYKNGIRVATSASNSTNFASNTLNYIGSTGVIFPFNYWPGYISNMRLVIGTAVYDPTLTTLTVPTTPLTAITNTALLTNFTNAGIYDAAVQNNAITVADAQVSTTQSKWSPTSVRFDGSGDYLNIPSSQGLNLGTGSLTIEAWVYLSAMSGDYFIVSSVGAGGGFFGFRSGTDIGYGRTGIAWDYQAASGMVINNWYHVAWSRNGTSMRIFVNGSQVGATQTTSQAYDLSTTSTAVGSAGATLFLNGYIQDLRITRGIGRYTANFSVPTAAFPTR